MKFVRLLSRLALLSLAAAAFAALTESYGNSLHRPLPNPQWWTVRLQRPSAPQLRRFPEFVGEAVEFIVVAVVGRTVLRLRLSPPPRREEQPILLDLH